MIPLDNLKTGMKLTILESSYYFMFKGIVLTVSAVSLPYVVVTTLSGCKYILDTRKCTLIKVTKQYVKAFNNDKATTMIQDSQLCQVVYAQ